MKFPHNEGKKRRKKEEKIAPIKSDTDTRGRRFVFVFAIFKKKDHT